MHTIADISRIGLACEGTDVLCVIPITSSGNASCETEAFCQANSNSLDIPLRRNAIPLPTDSRIPIIQEYNAHALISRYLSNDTLFSLLLKVS